MTPGTSEITAEMILALDELGVDWLCIILNGFLKDVHIPDDLTKSATSKRGMLLNVEITEGSNCWKLH